MLNIKFKKLIKKITIAPRRQLPSPVSTALLPHIHLAIGMLSPLLFLDSIIIHKNPHFKSSHGLTD